MKKSLFPEYVDRYLPRMDKLIELINGKRKPLVYLHKDMLRLEYSVDQTYTSASADTTYVSADFVDPNSPLPVKSRGTIKTSSGELPNIGMKFALNRKEINDINLMIARKVVDVEVLKKVFNDPVRCVVGMEEKLEAVFLEGLSNGTVGVIDDGSGEMIRINYGYLPENMFGATVAWGKEGSTPLSDLERVLAVATDTSKIMLSKIAYDLLRRSEEGRMLVANYRGQTVVDKSSLSIPTIELFDQAFKSEYKVDLIVVDRTVAREVNGKPKKYKPWNKDKVVFLKDERVGALVYGTLPEESADIPGVTKSKPRTYALLRKYSTLEPYTEITDIMGVVAPIIEGGNDIYVLDIAEAKEVDTNAESSDGGDTKITIAGQAYTKSEVIKALKAIVGGNIPSNIGDDKLIAKINELSDDDEAKLMQAISTHKA